MNQQSNKLHARIEDLMQAQVVTTRPDDTIGNVRRVMAEHKINSVPVVDGEGHAVGIVTSTDLVQPGSDERLVSEVMSDGVHTVPLYAEIALAARTMRRHHIHHVVVVHEKRVVGILSSFDLLKMVEDRTFTTKRGPSRPKHRRLSGGRRETDIHGHTGD